MAMALASSLIMAPSLGHPVTKKLTHGTFMLWKNELRWFVPLSLLGPRCHDSKTNKDPHCEGEKGVKISVEPNLVPFYHLEPTST